MEDMFGAVTLYTQQPVRVGDFCRIGNTVGTIEEIGLCTTTFGTIAHTLIDRSGRAAPFEPVVRDVMVPCLVSSKKFPKRRRGYERFERR
jgi:small-conductance mechanosensitive channel